jgi:hypothetical protein
MTAVANAIFTAAQFNTHVRDNLLETAPAKATTAGGIFVTSGANSISERVPATAFVGNSHGTSSTSYTDLTSAGPAVTVTTGTRALILYAARMSGSASTTNCHMSVAVSGASTAAASDNWAMVSTGTGAFSMSYMFLATLVAGSNTITAKYKAATTGTATFSNRYISVIPF